MCWVRERAKKAGKITHMRFAFDKSGIRMSVFIVKAMFDTRHWNNHWTV